MLVAFVFSDFWMYLFSYIGDMVQHHDELVRILWIYIPFMVFYALITFGSSLLSAIRKSQISAATVFIRQAIFVGVIWFCCTQDMEWVYWGVTVSEIIGRILMIAVSVYEFREVYHMMRPSANAHGCNTDE